MKLIEAIKASREHISTVLISMQKFRIQKTSELVPEQGHLTRQINPFFPTVSTCAVRDTASLGIMGAPRVAPLNPSESIVL